MQNIPPSFEEDIRLLLFSLADELFVPNEDARLAALRQDARPLALAALKEPNELLSWEEVAGWALQRRHPSPRVPGVYHAPVYQQNIPDLCGFHAFYNFKCTMQALYARSTADRLEAE